MPIGKLREEYESGASSTFVMQIDYLKGQGYSHIRRTRGDGDCFYRCEYPHPIMQAIEYAYYLY